MISQRVTAGGISAEACCSKAAKVVLVHVSGDIRISECDEACSRSHDLWVYSADSVEEMVAAEHSAVVRVAADVALSSGAVVLSNNRGDPFGTQNGVGVWIARFSNSADRIEDVDMDPHARYRVDPSNCARMDVIARMIESLVQGCGYQTDVQWGPGSFSGIDVERDPDAYLSREGPSEEIADPWVHAK